MFVVILAFISTVVSSLHYFDEIKAYDHVCNPMDYGAKGDGKTDDTKAIQAAINSCYGNKTNAQVYLPSGHTFLSYPLIMASCINCAFTIYAVAA